MTHKITVIGGGLAGTEAAWQIAKLGIEVDLFEMRPERNTEAHVTDHLSELVCSNSLGSTILHKAPGLLKAEMRGLGSLIIECATQTAVPAGSSLAVDRDLFAQTVTTKIDNHPRINVIREEMKQIPQGPTIIATGPLTSPDLAADIASLTGSDYLYFYDALSPIVMRDSVNMDIAFRKSRYDTGEQDDGDYINCPMTEEEYDRFFNALTVADTIQLRSFEQEDAKFFEGCMPVEQIAKRGRDSLRFGPMRPVGLIDPRTDKRPFAVVQLRQDNVAGTLFNLVGFQTNMKWGQQGEVLQLIPGLESAEFVRFGQMHRNTYVNSPELLHPSMQYRGRADLFFAGQITGVEGYAGNAATGLLAGINAARMVLGQHPLILPTNTMLGALAHYVTHADAKTFQPMKANFGLFVVPEAKMSKKDRYMYYAEKSLTAMRRFARSRKLAWDRQAAEAGTFLMSHNQ
ncbi:MAG: methylenetetrahydrofolate--tRNA-(uracil(54)-C(5))-methyltransferase (FADH(2)-oxidizing) TrmFO [Chloroflexota bacterium]